MVKRQEFLFLFESVFANANGDPLNGNHPRIDSETGKQFITMYRVKRTVRDYLKMLQAVSQSENEQILYRREKQEAAGKEDFLKTLKMIIEEKGPITEETVLNNFVDVRMFGGVIAIKDANMHLQGPIQVSYGQSLHEVEEQEIQISAVMPSSEKAKNGTLGFSYIVPYSLIAVDGTINQYNAEKTKLTDEDVNLFYNGLYEGTTALQTTSKNQKSLFLLKVTFKEEYQNTYLSNLKNYVSLNSEKPDLSLRSTSDYSVDVSLLMDKLNMVAHKIASVELKTDISLKVDNLDQANETLQAVFTHTVL